jgi:hypothetical protein
LDLTNLERNPRKKCIPSLVCGLQEAEKGKERIKMMWKKKKKQK